jgi:hypothetical protein
MPLRIPKIPIFNKGRRMLVTERVGPVPSAVELS